MTVANLVCRAVLARLAVVAGGMASVVACSKPPSMQLGGGSGGPIDADGGPIDGRPTDARPIDAGTFDVPPYIPGNPRLGAHELAYYKLGQTSATTIVTDPMTTQLSGSTIIVGIARGDRSKFVLPTDSKGNAPYRQLGDIGDYPTYPNSGTALYAFTSAAGGSNFTVRTTTGPIGTGQGDEITMAAIEVVDAGQVQDFQWNKLADESTTHTSASVSTTGPATLIALWWGDGFPGDMGQTAEPGDGFTLIESNTFEMHSFIQCAVAVKNVAVGGTYSVTWSVTPSQKSQMWLVAVH